MQPCGRPLPLFLLLVQGHAVQFIPGQSQLLGGPLHRVPQGESFLPEQAHPLQAVLRADLRLLRRLRAPYDQDKLPLRRVLGIVVRRLPQGGPPDLLMELAQLPAQDTRADGLGFSFAPGSEGPHPSTYPLKTFACLRFLLVVNRALRTSACGFISLASVPRCATDCLGQDRLPL